MKPYPPTSCVILLRPSSYKSTMIQMVGRGLSQNPAFFTAINKDTAELHHELVPFDGERAQKMSDRAVKIITACDHHELLPRVSNTPTFFVCKFCPYQDRCWKEARS